MAKIDELTSQDVTVAVADVHMRYKVPSTGSSSSSSPRGRRLARAVLGRSPEVVVRALTGVSLVARRGESIGVIGTNGSGKSTLLRVIAGVEPATRGTVLASSAPVLLGVNASLVQDLSGEQNVRLGCLAMGLTPEQTRDALPQIVDLAGIGDAIHLPMRSYSSGMGARLRFAIAAAANPHILLIDEALATGDATFKERSRRRMDELREQAGTVFLVSHAAKTVQEMCTRAIWLHKGSVVLDGPAEDVAPKYRWWAWNVAKGEQTKADGLLESARRSAAPTKIALLDPPRGGAGPRHARSW